MRCIRQDNCSENMKHANGNDGRTKNIVAATFRLGDRDSLVALGADQAAWLSPSISR